MSKENKSQLKTIQNKSQLYCQLFKEFKSAHTSMSHNDCDVKVANIWKSLKSQEHFEALVKEEINKWKLKAKERTLKLDKFWGSIPKRSTIPQRSFKQDSTENAVSITSSNQNCQQSEGSTTNPINVDQYKETTSTTSIQDSQLGERSSKSVATPIQDKLKCSILGLKSDIIYLENKKSQHMASDEQLKQLVKYRKDLNKQEKELKSAISNQIRQQKKRESNRKAIEEVMTKHPDTVAVLRKPSKKLGRPRCEEQQSSLLEAIIDVATYGAGADQKRRTNMIRSIKTLDELTAELNSQGYKIKRGAVYLRLLPRCSQTTEGKRHIVTVPVKLARATNDLHSQHVDTKFCIATIKYLEEIASVLGPKQVMFLSQDDKARVPIGKTAANKQTPLLMHLLYCVRLPDHDWVVAEKHKLIPSVYAFIQIEAGKYGDAKAVTYSGPTFITIRSGKHCRSTAYAHAKDFDSLMNCSDFEEFCKNDSGEFKPVVIITSDGGPDENPRYQKTIDSAIRHFKQYNLDAIFIATNAPGRSAYNRVERRMAALSRELAGLILDHQKVGTHLNEKGETIDTEMEKKNFEHAGKTLAEIWSEMVIDKYPTIARYISPEQSEFDEIEIETAIWKSAHVRESHYCVQVVKCSDRSCCTQPRSSYFQMLNQFIPAPLCITDEAKLHDNSNLDNKFTSLFLRMALKDEHLKVGIRKEVPFDCCCPSLKEILASRTCECGIYHGTKKSLAVHQRTCTIRTRRVRTEKQIISVNESEPRMTRAKRLADIRQGERMVIWSSRLNAEHIDWFDDDNEHEVDVETLPLSLPLPTIIDTIPTIDLDVVMNNEWEEEESTTHHRYNFRHRQN